MADKQGQASPEVQQWLNQLKASLKREKEFRKEGRRISKLYDAEKAEDTPYNILYSNTETLAPALFNNMPRPVVERRYKDADPMGKLAAEVCERSLAFLLDSNDQDYSNFDEMIKSAVLEALLPGRGWTRFKYDATFSGEGEQRTVKAESACGEEVPWDRMLFGYAKKWKDVPWVAIEHFMDKGEVESMFGAEIANAMVYPLKGGQEDDTSDGEAKSESGNEDDIERLAHVYEIWDKGSKQVIFVSDSYAEVLKKVPDPLGLSGFFPGPRPLQFTMKVSSMLPTALYQMYENQAKELNLCTTRINKIMHALKVRGFYDSTLTGLNNLLEAADNTLLPAENVSAMLQGQTLEKAIWFFPLNDLVGVLQQLYLQRQQIKDVIYEITGVSDILRGSSVASETATAQNIKNQWGTLRLKKAQKEVQRYVRDCLRIMAEIAVSKLSVTTVAAMTGMQLPTAAQKQQAQLLATQMQQVAVAQAQQTGQPPQPQPQQAQQMQQIQKILGTPSWEDVMGMLQNQIQRHYRIDIETNSTVDAEATEDKSDVAEFLNAMSQFMNGVGPLVEQGMMQFDVAKAMILAIVRRFRFGTQVEDLIENMQAPPPKQPGDDPKAQADAAAAKLKMEVAQAQAAHDQQMQQQDAQLKQAETAAKMEELQMKRELAQAEHQLKLQEIAAKTVQAQAQSQAVQVTAAAKAEAAQAQAAAAKSEPKGE